MVVGAGQAGLSAAYFLAHRGFAPHSDFVVLDANHGPGGAWQHRWPSLDIAHVHGLHPLPGLPPGDVDPGTPAREAVAAYFDRYERAFGLPVVRPAPVTAVREHHDSRLLVESAAGTWSTRALVNATGTWTRPFWPAYPGAATFRGRQLHAAHYRSAEEFAGRHVVVVGGGTSAVQLLVEIARVTSTTWVTRRPPVWREAPFDIEAGRAAVALVEDAVAAGRRPSSVVGVTGLYLDDGLRAARELGVLDRLPVPDRIIPDGLAWDNGRTVRADVILWATGFRAALDHLAPLQLRDPAGGIRMVGTRTALDARVHLVGYGPSASTIGANRAGRVAVREISALLGRS